MEQHLNICLSGQGCAMRELDLLDTDLTSLAPELLGTAVNSLEKVNLSGSKLRGEQLDPMFQQFDFRVLADLNLDYLDISAVQPESLAMVLINLRRVSLKKCSLAAAQTQLIFETIARNEPADIKLRSANFYGNNLKEAAAEHLSEAAARLEQLDLSTTGLPDSAAAALLQHIGRAEAGQLRLRHLVLAGLCLARVAAEHITAAMVRRRTSVYFYQRFYPILLMLLPYIWCCMWYVRRGWRSWTCPTASWRGRSWRPCWPPWPRPRPCASSASSTWTWSRWTGSCSPGPTTTPSSTIDITSDHHTTSHFAHDIMNKNMSADTGSLLFTSCCNVCAFVLKVRKHFLHFIISTQHYPANKYLCCPLP